ncbi:alpha/beta fold hydrolase [Paenibacillus xerothermodurans]|uniref:Alpha/beta fold hydrolase n=1 Tax=Paenibacillus xerothermodurans TaxID=1977292 RepID=A0A2W1NPA6_PAEXE|nr:alpha/beta hydrolase [Paenibacillus xerothermodurans]PZE19576.1 alpha/beta fold hydrolase [Paenibacillus xerothermodurans]
MPMAEVNGTRIHYHKMGKGVPIICIHPPALTGDCFAYLRARLSDSFQVITLDVRGHGQSAPSAAQVTYPLIAEDIRQLMDKLRLRQAYLCGYSQGGSVAMHALLTYPEQFLGGILISSMPELSDWYNRSLIKLMLQLAKLRSRHAVAAVISAGNADMMWTFKNQFRHSAHGNVRNMYEYFASSLDYSCTRRLKDIHAPTLLLYGQKDHAFHRYALTLQHSLPNSTLHLIDRAGHQLVTKEPARLEQSIRAWMDYAKQARDHDVSDTGGEIGAYPVWRQESEVHEEQHYT